MLKNTQNVLFQWNSLSSLSDQFAAWENDAMGQLGPESSNQAFE